MRVSSEACTSVDLVKVIAVSDTDNLYKTGVWTGGWHTPSSPPRTSNNEDLRNSK